MDKIEAIKQLENFKELTDIKRDECREIYNYFKSSDIKIKYTRNDGTIVYHEEFWDYITTSDINEVYKKDYQKLHGLYSILDEDLINDNTKLRKENVKIKDKLQFERKNFNKNLKEINALEELNKELIENIKKLEPVQVLSGFEPCKVDTEAIGVIVLSDLHLNELIDIGSNKYDFDVASKRLKKLADYTIKSLIGSVKHLVLLGLGDFLNSDRRISEYLNMATNRGKAIILAFNLLRQFISHLNKFFTMSVAMVSGNESRVIGTDFDTSDEIATYNYDYTIYNMLKIAFENNDSIKFIDGNFGEKVLDINGSNVLITHGINIQKDVEKSVAQTFGRYANAGVNLDYMFMGHYHSCRIGDIYTRCGSLCGGNSYSEGTLNLTSKASQVIGIFHSDKSNNILKVDLQNVDGINGYNIEEDLKAYNAKTVSNKDNFVIYKI